VQLKDLNKSQSSKFSVLYWDSTDMPWLLQLVLQNQMIRIRTQILEIQIERRWKGESIDCCIKPSKYC
jgi:hypothetical protein